MAGNRKQQKARKQQRSLAGAYFECRNDYVDSSGNGYAYLFKRVGLVTVQLDDTWRAEILKRPYKWTVTVWSIGAGGVREETAMEVKTPLLFVELDPVTSEMVVNHLRDYPNYETWGWTAKIS